MCGVTFHGLVVAFHNLHLTVRPQMLAFPSECLYIPTLNCYVFACDISSSAPSFELILRLSTIWQSNFFSGADAGGRRCPLCWMHAHHWLPGHCVLVLRCHHQLRCLQHVGRDYWLPSYRGLLTSRFPLWLQQFERYLDY
jgi:hypothetical protein